MKNDELWIEKVTLSNYRQYYNTVTIDFPKEDTFSVIVGTNGTGKSNFWNAIHWCLFGKEPHIKSNKTPSIINKNCLQESIGKKIIMFVELVVATKNTKYLIRRQIEGLLHRLEYDEKNAMLIMSNEDPVPRGFEITGRNNSTSFQVSNNGGRYDTKSDSQSFKSLVSRYIIPEALSRFFILDGEFLQELFDNFGSIQSGIDQISQINILNDAIEYVENMRFPKIKSSGEMAEIQERIKHHDQYLQSEDENGIVQTSSTETVYGTDDQIHVSGRPRVKDLKRSLSNISEKHHNLKQRMENSHVFSKTELKDRHTSMLEERATLNDRLNAATDEHMSLLLINGPFIMCKTQVGVATRLIHEEMDRGNLPNRAKRNLMNDLLEKKSCICGALLHKGTKARERVETEILRTSDNVQYDIADDIKHHNDQFLNNYDAIVTKIDTEMENIDRMRTQLRKLDQNIREIERKIPDQDEDYGDLINEFNGIESDEKKYQRQLWDAERQVADHIQRRADETRRFDNVKSRVRKETEAILLIAKSEIVRSTLHAIKDCVEETTRYKVSQETLKIFNNLTWKKRYKQLVIDDSYHMNVAGDDRFEMSSGMSAGEKLFLALSFIMALKRITEYHFPLIIDSPLGKTGGSLRIRFGKHMPELLKGSQLIMLASDTEYNDTKIKPSDGGDATHTLKELLQEKTSVTEYKIDFDLNKETANIVAVGGT